MLIKDSVERSCAKTCYQEIISLQPKNYNLINLISENTFKRRFVATLKNDQKKVLVDLISSLVDKDHLKQVLKESIILTRIKCVNLIQNFNSYFIENKQLYVVTNHYEVIITNSKRYHLNKKFKFFLILVDKFRDEAK
jgi:hypothetical protein